MLELFLRREKKKPGAETFACSPGYFGYFGRLLGNPLIPELKDSQSKITSKSKEKREGRRNVEEKGKKKKKNQNCKQKDQTQIGKRKKNETRKVIDIHVYKLFPFTSF